MTRQQTIAVSAFLMATLFALTIGALVGLAEQRQQQHREELAAEFQASDEAAKRTLNAVGIAVENGVVVQQ